MTEPTTQERKGPLSSYRVLDISDRKGVLGPKFLAEYGADVIRIERPGGDPMRLQPPFAGDIEDPERGFFHLYRNAGKRGITLDIEHPEGRQLFTRLVETADVLYESFAPGYLDKKELGWEKLREINPRLIQVSISEYGEDGPRSSWRGSGITSFAMSGAMSLGGWPERPPNNAPHTMAYDSAAAYANVAVMMAIWSRHSSGEGQRIEMSAQEAGHAGLYPWEVPTYSYGGMGPIEAVTVRGGVSETLFECKDGWVRITMTLERHWAAILKTLGNPVELEGEEFADVNFRMANPDVIKEIVSQHTRQYTMEEFMALAQPNGVPLAAVRPPSGFMADPNTRIRNFWTQIDHPVAGKAEYAGIPLRMSGSEMTIGRPAPRVGEHNAEILGELGLSAGDLDKLRAAGAI